MIGMPRIVETLRSRTLVWEFRLLKGGECESNGAPLSGRSRPVAKITITSARIRGLVSFGTPKIWKPVSLLADGPSCFLVSRSKLPFNMPLYVTAELTLTSTSESGLEEPMCVQAVHTAQLDSKYVHVKGTMVT